MEYNDDIVKGVRVRSRCQHYGEGEKSSGFFSKFGRSARFSEEYS